MRPTQKSVRGWGFTAVLVLLVFSFVSCKYELVKEPTHNFNEKKNAADYNDYILPPKNITASQGLKCAVELEWEAVPNAVQYYIYSAATPYDTFQKVSETKADETEISIDEESGITKYYCVSAVNYYGTVSSKSIVVSGSTLAVPIITEITASEDGNCVEVGWWMDNCTKSTYADYVVFYINVYSAQNLLIASYQKDGYSRKTIVPDLTSTTEYKFEVEAVNAQTSSKEQSGKTTAETAHRIIPDAPVSFNAAQGESAQNVRLSWILPQKAWYRENSGVSGFVQHALYFNIYRKPAGQDLEYGNPVFVMHITGEYVPGDTVTWDDITAERGKKYVYFIQSVTDGTAAGKTITSDSSKTAELEGWKISEPVFAINSEYTQSTGDNPKFTRIRFNYNLSFATLGKSYTYFVEKQRSDFDNNITGAPAYRKFYSLTEVNAALDDFDFTENYDNLSNVQGYYKYTLYICPSGSSDNSAAIETIPASGKYIVTDNVNMVPKVEEFTVEDGYSDKFKLSWKYNSEYNYTIYWTDQNGTESLLELKETDLSISGNTATYEHTAVSGDSRIYTLQASLGLEAQEVYKDNEGNPIICKTLGTVQPQIISYEYDKLLIKWPAVQKSNGTYTVSAKYEDDNNTELVTNSNCSISDPDSDSIIKCEISNPSGYNDAKKSGKKINLTVTTQSNKDSTTCQPFEVCTVGPALTNLQIPKNTKYKDRIIISWSGVQGAQGYLIRRIAHKTSNGDIEPDDYYFDGTNLFAGDNQVTEARAKVQVNNGTFTLTDIYKEADDETNQYERNQSSISWGIPFGYVVLPIKQGGSRNDFTQPFYSNLEENYGATYGYGYNLHAQKSESSKTQKIEWNVPYNASGNPVIYYREVNTAQWTEKKLPDFGVATGGKQTATFDIPDTLKAYEYFVSYNKDQLPSDMYPSFAADTEVGLSLIETSYDYTDKLAEKANKGYLLTTDYTARTGPESGYSELVSWDVWNYNYRSIGPSKAYICITNYNLSSDPITVAELDKDLHYSGSSDAENTIITNNPGDYNIISIEPQTLMDGSLNNPVTKGPLQVLRDAKHYYSIKMYSGEDESTSQVVNNGTYAYRNLNDYEFAKMVMVIFADGMKQIGELSFDDKEENPRVIIGAGAGGEIRIYHEATAGSSGKNYDYSYIDYSPELLTPSGEKTRTVKINATSICHRNGQTYGTYPRSFDEVTIYVTKDAEMPETYEGNIKFNLNSYESGSLTSRTASFNINSAEKRRLIIPVKMFIEINWKLQQVNDEAYDQDPTYGWWPASN